MIVDAVPDVVRDQICRVSENIGREGSRRRKSHEVCALGRDFSKRRIKVFALDRPSAAYLDLNAAAGRPAVASFAYTAAFCSGGQRIGIAAVIFDPRYGQAARCVE